MYGVVKSLDLLRLNNNTMLKEVIDCLQELMVMDENVCEFIRRGVNGLSARLFAFCNIEVGKVNTPFPTPPQTKL